MCVVRLGYTWGPSGADPRSMWDCIGPLRGVGVHRCLGCRFGVSAGSVRGVRRRSRMACRFGVDLTRA